MHLSSNPNSLQLPWCPFLYSLFTSLSASFSQPLLKPQHGLSCLAQDKSCLRLNSRGERSTGTKEAFIAVGSGWLQTDNGHILQFLKQISVSAACPEELDRGQQDWESYISVVVL